MNKKLISIIAIVVVLVIAAVYVINNVNECSDCGKTFFGKGYEPNILNELLGDNQAICEDCAMKQHAISLGLGKTLEDFKIK